MATQTLRRMLFVANPAAENIKSFPEGSGQTFRTGDLLILSSGKVVIAQAAGTTNLTTEKIVGMALMDATGTADSPIMVHVFDTRTEIVIQFRNAATAVAGNGEAKALRNHTGNIWTAEDTTSNGKILQMGIHPQYPVGDTNGWIVGKFEAADLQFP